MWVECRKVYKCMNNAWFRANDADVLFIDSDVKIIHMWRKKEIYWTRSINYRIFLISHSSSSCLAGENINKEEKFTALRDKQYV